MWNMFKINKKDPRTMLTLDIFKSFSSISIVDIEQVNIYRDRNHWEHRSKLD